MGTGGDTSGDIDRVRTSDSARASARSGRRRRAWSRGALAGLAAAVGCLVGLRAVIRVELPGLAPLLGLDVLPREGLGVAWSDSAIWPADLQVAALERLLVVLALLVLSAVAVATLNALILMTESASSRAAELAVRSAVGASPRRLLGMLVREVRTLLAAGLGLGVVGGAALGGLARALWPEGLVDPAVGALGDVTLAVGLIVALLTVAHVSTGLSAGSARRAATVLRSGVRTGADPMEIFVRKVLTAGHASLAGTVIIASLTLGGAVSTGDSADDGPAAVAIPATAPTVGAWAPMLERIGEIPGIEAESLAAPGALLGLGVRAVATAQCGPCSRGLIPTPFLPAMVDHHAVAPGWFALTGTPVVDGRDFLASDGADAEPVAVVNEIFARDNFYRGQPIGRQVRIGSGLHSWYRVVGVVDDSEVVPVPGADETPMPTVYLSALQAPPRQATVLVRGDGVAVEAAAAVLAGGGFAPAPARPVAAHRAEAARALRWARDVTVLIALLALALAAHGVYAMALQTTRRRAREIAIRRALGADARGIVRYVLGERLRVVAWGLAGFVFFGSLMVALLQNAAGLPVVGPLAYAAIGFGLAGVAMVASTRAAREALTVEPATVMD